MKAPAAGVAALLALGAAATPSQAADRSRPPAAGPARPLTLPPVQRTLLGNGLPVLVAESHDVPVADLLLLIRAGTAADPAERTGVAAMTADMLDEGAAGKDALALAGAFDELGAALELEAAWDYTSVRLHVPVARLSQALPLFGDVVLRPDFPAAELERLRKESLTALLQARDEPTTIASWAVDRAVFGDSHRYGRSESGDARALAALSVDDLRRFHGRYYHPGNAVLVVTGDVTPAVVKLLEATFGSWSGTGAEPVPAPPTPAQVRGRVLWLVDKPDAPQSILRVARVGPPRLTKDYHALEVMNTLLGGSFASRLNDNLRETHGYAYGARSGFGYRRVGGLFVARSDVQTDVTAPALTEMLKELERIATPATAAEVERSRSYLALTYPWGFETTRDLASKLGGRAIYELPDDVFATFVPRALAIGAADIERAARAWIDPRNAAIVVVGDRRKIEAPLAALGLGRFRVLSVDDVMGPAPRVAE